MRPGGARSSVKEIEKIDCYIYFCEGQSQLIFESKFHVPMMKIDCFYKKFRENENLKLDIANNFQWKTDL